MIGGGEIRMGGGRVWLGMGVDEWIWEVEEFWLYVDFAKVRERYEYVVVVGCREWWVEGKRVVMEGGMDEKRRIEKEGRGGFLEEYEVMWVIEKEVMDI